MVCLTSSMMRASGIGDAFFRSTVERRITVASRKEILDAMLIGLTICGGRTGEPAMLGDDEAEGIRGEVN